MSIGPQHGICWRHRSKVVLLPGVGVLLGLLLGESLLRCFAPQPGYDLPRNLFIAQPATLYGLRPGVRLTCRVAGSSFGVRVNHLGLRGPEPRSTSVSARVLVLGDSTTFGFGVEEADSFAARLQRLLARKSHPGIEVLNAGVPGYSTWQSLANLRRLAARLRPDVVILAFYEGNDFLDNLRERHPRVVDGILCSGPAAHQDQPGTWPARRWWSRVSVELRWALEQSHLFRLVRRAFGESGARRASLAGMVSDAGFRILLDRAWERTRSALDEVLLETRRLDTPLVLMTLPSAHLFDATAESREAASTTAVAAVLHQRLVQWAGRRRVHWVSTERALRQAANSGPVVLEADRHYNARGHAAQARELAAALDRWSLLEMPLAEAGLDGFFRGREWADRGGIDGSTGSAHRSAGRQIPLQMEKGAGFLRGPRTGRRPCPVAGRSKSSSGS